MNIGDFDELSTASWSLSSLSSPGPQILGSVVGISQNSPPEPDPPTLVIGTDQTTLFEITEDRRAIINATSLEVGDSGDLVAEISSLRTEILTMRAKLEEIERLVIDMTYHPSLIGGIIGERCRQRASGVKEEDLPELPGHDILQTL